MMPVLKFHGKRILIYHRFKIESTPKTHKINSASFRDFWRYFHFFQLADTQASPNLKK